MIARRAVPLRQLSFCFDMTLGVCGRVSQHENRCHWLNDNKFLRDLESDSVDSETLDEELRSLELQETNT